MLAVVGTPQGSTEAAGLVPKEVKSQIQNRSCKVLKEFLLLLQRPGLGSEHSQQHAHCGL